MNKKTLLVLLLITTILLIVMVYILGLHFPNFFENFFSNLLSTLLGAIVGVPIALFLYHHQKKDEIEQRHNDQIKRQIKILQLLKGELESNQRTLTEINADFRFTSENFKLLFYVAYKLKDAYWKALSNGGEIQWITDVELLNKLAWVYHSTKQVVISGDSLVKSFIKEPHTGPIIIESMEKQFLEDVDSAKRELKETLQMIEKEVLLLNK